MTLHVNVAYSDCCFMGILPSGIGFILALFSQCVCVTVDSPLRLRNLSCPCLSSQCAILVLSPFFSSLHLWIFAVSRSSYHCHSSQYLALCSVLVSSSWMFYMLMTHKGTPQVGISSWFTVSSLERLKEFHSLFGLLLPISTYFIFLVLSSSQILKSPVICFSFISYPSLLHQYPALFFRLIFPLDLYFWNSVLPIICPF